MYENKIIVYKCNLYVPLVQVVASVIVHFYVLLRCLRLYHMFVGCCIDLLECFISIEIFLVNSGEIEFSDHIILNNKAF